MPQLIQTTQKSYTNLLNSIKVEIEVGRKAIERQRAITYWKIGRHVARNLLQNKSRAGYGKELIARLSKDTRIQDRTLWECIQFYKTFPILNGRSELKWTHYRALIKVSNKTKRERLFQNTISNKLNSSQLIEKIKQSNQPAKPSPQLTQATQAPLNYRRGLLNTYIIESVTPTTIKIDCGFNTYEIHQTQKKLAASDIVHVRKHRRKAVVEKSPDSKKDLYTFKAKLRRVVDGDTIWVEIDCGFSFRLHQKLRLRGIDAPEMKTKAGQRAKRFVESRLKRDSALVVKTYGSDKYDRYLVDVFYLIGEKDSEIINKEGIFLNQELVDKGMAGVWRG